MRLHSLRLSAVGPFAGDEVIDFDRLSAGGLFLFEGPTGVGKSTILDALTFALYGGLASESGDPARMRSHFADPGQRPEVQLEFSVRGARWRITRSPEFLRAKKRGTGLTTEKASVHLERRVDSTWESQSHAKDEVGPLIGELLGLSREQFRQVVLLPQGEFATFLRADDDDRRRVLGRLFGTQFFERIALGLQARAQAAGRALLEADTELGSRVAAAAEAAGLSSRGHEELAATSLPARLGGLVALGEHLDRQERAALMIRTAADGQADQARAAVERAQAVLVLVDRRAEAHATLASAQARSEEHTHRVARQDRARRARPLSPVLDLADSTEQDVTSLRAEVARASLPNDPAPEHLDGSGSAQLAEEAATARTSAGELAHLAAAEAALPADRAAVGQQRQAVHDLAEQFQGIVGRAQAIPAELSTVRERLAAARSAVAAAPGAQALLDAVAPQVEAALQLETLHAAVAELKAAQRVAKRAFDEAHDHHALLLDQQLADVRGELATRLVAGSPCLVCGSAEHPAPAEAAAAGVSPEQVRRAAAARDECRLLLDEAQVALVRAQADLDSATRLAGGHTAQQWQDRVGELRAQVAAGGAAEATLGNLEAHTEALAAEQDDVAGQLQALTQQLAAARADLSHREEELAARDAQVTAARGPHESVRERVAALSSRAAACDDLAGAVQDLARGRAAASAAGARASAEVREAGFVDLADARTALLAPDALEELDQEIAQWEATVAGARQALASPELQQVADIDPEAAAAAAQAAGADLARTRERARAATEECTVASRQRQRFAERHVEVQECARRRTELAVANEEVLALDQYARGMAGTPRMSLVTYVLRYWFEQVVTAANLRLESMSAGKYELLRVDDAARKGDRVGLGLAVLDRHTGRERSPATLSGGECFYTSLALALGLADVVVAQAGGAQLDTLFIDEGFGSLDPDTLDDVMGVIDDLRGNGRVIGIVSHVPELKERIAERLSVRRTRSDGPSTIEVVA